MRPLFHIFSLFKLGITVYPELFKQILVDLSLKQERTVEQMCQLSSKYIEANGRDNDLKIASFSLFFEMIFFEIQCPFIATTIKIFLGGGRGGDTFKTPSPYEQLLPLPTPCFKMFLERSLNGSHPHHPTSSIFHCYPLPIHHPYSP